MNPQNDHKSAVGSFKSELWNFCLFDAKPTKVSQLTGTFLFVVTWFCAIDEAFLVRLDLLQSWQPNLGRINPVTFSVWCFDLGHRLATNVTYSTPKGWDII